MAPSTQNQAFSALLYFWGHVLERKLPEIDAGQTVPKQRLPVVLSQDEVRRLLAAVSPESGATRATARLLWCGECHRLAEND